MCRQMVLAMREAQAPREQYERMGLTEYGNDAEEG